MSEEVNWFEKKIDKIEDILDNLGCRISRVFPVGETMIHGVRYDRVDVDFVCNRSITILELEEIFKRLEKEPDLSIDYDDIEVYGPYTPEHAKRTGYGTHLYIKLYKEVK